MILQTEPFLYFYDFSNSSGVLNRLKRELWIFLGFLHELGNVWIFDSHSTALAASVGVGGFLFVLLSSLFLYRGENYIFSCLQGFSNSFEIFLGNQIIIKRVRGNQYIYIIVIHIISSSFCFVSVWYYENSSYFSFRSKLSSPNGFSSSFALSYKFLKSIVFASPKSSKFSFFSFFSFFYPLFMSINNYWSLSTFWASN